MIWIRLCALCVLALVLSLTAASAAEGEEMTAADEQAAMMAAWQKAMALGDPHAKMAREEGSWKMTSRMWMDPAGEPMVSSGTAERRMTLGGRVLEETVSAEMMGQPFEGIGRRGYDNVSGRYWATWTDSMSTGLFVSHGEVAEDGSVIYHGEFDDPMTGGKTKARSVIRWQDDDTQLFEWYEDRGEGEVKTMEITYERQRAASP